MLKPAGVSLTSPPGISPELEVFGPREEAARSRELGKTALREGDLSEARRHCEEAVGWQPGEMDNWSRLADVLMETQAYREVRTVETVVITPLLYSVNFSFEYTS